ncbi:MAG: endonuclease/exonuclease/phosphatase family protein [Sphingomonas sp.]|nr:endonuclease/exonuclease/phosphatase family protein [Sphingomonas sp.]
MLTRRSLLIAAAYVPLGACARSIILSGEPRGLRVATSNSWHDARNSLARLSRRDEQLGRAGPDVIALQEVLEDKARNLPNQAETLARALGGYSTRFASTSPEGAPRRYGNAVLTRLPIIETSSVALEPTNDFRTALRVRVDLNGSPADMVCTHLAWQAEAGAVRARQVEHLLSWLPADGVPLVLMGDFNAALDDPGLARLEEACAARD